MRDVYMVCYDICDPKRLRKVHRITREYGDRLQYSVFLCRLDRKRLLELSGRLGRVIDSEDD